MFACLSWSFVAWVVGIGMGLFAGVMLSDKYLVKPLAASLGRERETVALLTNSVMTMRQQGFATAKPATVKEGDDPEANGLARAEAQLIQRRDDAHFIQRAKTDLMRRNPRLTEREALAEAVKLRRSVTDEDSPT